MGNIVRSSSATWSGRTLRKLRTPHFWSHMVWVIFRTVLIIGISFMILYPIAVKFITAIKSNADLFDPTVLLVPKSPTLENIEKVWEVMEYIPTLLRTSGFTVFNALLQTVSCTVTAYGLARFRYKLRNVFFMLVLITLIVPAQTILLPQLLQYQHFSFEAIFAIIPPGRGADITNTMVPFVLTSCTAMGLKNGLYIYMLRQCFINMPPVLEEAAYMDGCGVIRTFYRIMLPNAFTMMLTVFLFSYVWLWNDNLYISFFAGDLKYMTTMLVSAAETIAAREWSGISDPSMLAVYRNVAVVLHILPLVLIYIIAQKFFVQSIEKSGIVG